MCLGVTLDFDASKKCAQILTSSSPNKIAKKAAKVKIPLRIFGSANGHRSIHHTPCFPPKNDPGPNR
jgi:hypothetical protein